jgi:methionyl-tRNA formyltransferase
VNAENEENHAKRVNPHTLEQEEIDEREREIHEDAGVTAHYTQVLLTIMDLSYGLIPLKKSEMTIVARRPA